MSSWLDSHTDQVDWGDARNFVLSFPLFTPLQLHSWAVASTGYGPEEGWFPSDATAEEQVMYGLYWLDIGIGIWAISGEYYSVTAALYPLMDLAAPAAPALVAASVFLAVNQGRGMAQEKGSPVYQPDVVSDFSLFAGRVLSSIF